MSTAAAEAGSPGGLPAALPNFALRLILIAIADAFALLLGVSLINDGNVFLGATILVTALLLTIVNILPNLWPLRWMTPALALIALLVIYPFGYTFYIAFTNYSDGHRYARAEALQLMSREKYLPEGEASYSWEIFRNEAGEYALWLSNENETLFATTTTITLVETAGEIPESYEGYTLLTGGERFRALGDVQGAAFGDPNNPVGVASRSAAGTFRQRWVWDESRGVLMDMENNIPYRADDTTGSFVAPNGSTAPLGYWVPVGLNNFARIFSDSLIAGPLVRIFLWTVAFAFFSVFTSFVVGLFMAIVLNRSFPGVRVVRSLLIIPYAVPGMISILIWRGMLNPNLGVIATNIENIFGWSPPFLTDPGWAKFSVLLVNLWLSYPYFMLICSGALQAIPSAIYEAAEVDGANARQKFFGLTLPLLLVSVGPLLIASFTYNFNNFLLIEALTRGGPAMAGTSAPPVGHTDNLISYVFRFAFGAGGSRDYGFASAIAIIIFVLVGLLTIIQFRFSKRLEEIGENV